MIYYFRLGSLMGTVAQFYILAYKYNKYYYILIYRNYGRM